MPRERRFVARFTPRLFPKCSPRATNGHEATRAALPPEVKRAPASKNAKGASVLLCRPFFFFFSAVLHAGKSSRANFACRASTDKPFPPSSNCFFRAPAENFVRTRLCVPFDRFAAYIRKVRSVEIERDRKSIVWYKNDVTLQGYN